MFLFGNIIWTNGTSNITSENGCDILRWEAFGILFAFRLERNAAKAHWNDLLRSSWRLWSIVYIRDALADAGAFFFANENLCSPADVNPHRSIIRKSATCGLIKNYCYWKSILVRRAACIIFQVRYISQFVLRDVFRLSWRTQQLMSYVWKLHRPRATR